MPRNLQILCHEHNQEKMIKFDDWRPLWARVLMPVRDTPAARRAEIRAALSPHEYNRVYATTPLHAVQVGCSDPLSPYPANMQGSCDGLRNNPESRALALAEDYGQAVDSRVGCRCCPDGGVNVSAYSAHCGALRRLQMALVKTPRFFAANRVCRQGPVRREAAIRSRERALRASRR
jgi:hypothetical protein